MEELIKNELEFYSKFARPLIINLPESSGEYHCESCVPNRTLNLKHSNVIDYLKNEKEIDRPP